MVAVPSWLAGWWPGYEKGTGGITQPADIYPVHFIDQAAMIRDRTISYAFRFDQVLDADALHDALRGLLEVGDWRKLGGRLRLNRRGSLEIHVPDRPVVRFSHRELPLRISDHDLGQRLPRKTGRVPSTHAGCPSFRPLFLPDALPGDVRHYLATDEPLLCLRVTSFADATLVALTFPHAVGDAMGAAALLRAWSRVLAGRADLVAPVAGAREDVMRRVGGGADPAARGRFVLEDQLTRGFTLLLFAARWAWDVLTRRRVEARYVFLPAGFVARLRRQAEAELVPAPAPGEAQPPAPFVSDGDLITAWGASMVIRSRALTRPAVICNVFDLRGRLEDTFAPGMAYLQNLILPSTTILPAAHGSAASVPQIALAVRRAIATQTGDRQARRLMRIARASFAAWGTMPLFAPADAMVLGFSNWSKARLLDAVDFGPAVVASSPGAVPDRSAAAAAAAAEGRPTAFWGGTLSADRALRDAIIVQGEDAAGDYWLNGMLRSETWALIESEFKQYERVHIGKDDTAQQ